MHRGVAVVAMLALVGSAACVSQNVTIPSGSGPRSAVLTVSAGPDHAAVLRFGGAEQVGGNHCWTPDDAAPGQRCTDVTLPASRSDYLDLPRATRLEVRGSAVSPTAGLQEVETNATGPPTPGPSLPLTLDRGAAVLDVPGGEYILRLTVPFPESPRSYTFAIRII